MKQAKSPVNLVHMPMRARALVMAITLGFGVTAAMAATPVIHVVDPSPVNWLSITWNTMEELVPRR